jgi:hypothetical protein
MGYSKIKIKIIFLLIITTILFGCSDKILFTQDIRKKIEEQKFDIKRIQFYNSKRFTVRRKINTEELNVAAGNIKTEGGINYEQIIIKKGTPAVCDSTTAFYLYISFEQGKNFCFTRYYNSLLNPFYKLLTKQTIGLGPINLTYNNKTYLLTEKNKNIFLKIKKENLKLLHIDKRFLKGIKVSDK